MAKFWTCDSCEREITDGANGRLRWWKDLPGSDEGKTTFVIFGFEILCFDCHSKSVNYIPGRRDCIENWHTLDRFDERGWGLEFALYLEREIFAVPDLKAYGKIMRRVIGGDQEDGES